MHGFLELKFPPALEKALKSLNFEIPTPIQAQAIPIAMVHRDLIANVQTGMGKTSAFLIPIIARLLKVQSKSALILAPSCDFATRITQVLRKLTQFCPEMRDALLIDGGPIQPQIQALDNNPRLIIATPSKLIEHLRSGSLSLSSTEVLVLDQADQMLELGFSPQLNEILRFLPKTRQTLLFSATLPMDLEKLSARFLKDPVRITVDAVPQPVKKIKQPIMKKPIAKNISSLGCMLAVRKTKKISQNLNSKMGASES